MHTPSTRILSALAYVGGEEFDPEMALTPDLLEALSLIEQARPIVGDDGPYERARQRRRERREQAAIPDWFSAEDLIVAADAGAVAARSRRGAVDRRAWVDLSDRGRTAQRYAQAALSGCRCARHAEAGSHRVAGLIGGGWARACWHHGGVVHEVWGDETELVRALVEWAALRVARPTDSKTTARPASELGAAAGRTVTPAGIGGAEALRVFREVLLPATRSQDDPMNLAYIPSSPTRAAVAFDLVTSAANVFAGIWEAGAGAIHAENEALGWIIELLGWPPGAAGCFVSGGTVGNLSALAAARHAALVRRGERPPGGWRLACTADVHSSIRLAARVLDVGIVEVPEDARGHLTGEALAGALSDGSDDVFAVVACAGTTNAGLVDDLMGVSAMCAEHGVWLHVDGAYGGAALAAPSVRRRFDGVERADSFIVDPHKWLFAPYDCCALVYRDPACARAAHSQAAGYLDQIDREAGNPSDLAIHLSRRARGLPFWFSLATHGTDRYVAAIERTLETTRTVADAIRAADHVHLVCEPELSVILFERPGWDDDQYAVWSNRLAKHGVILCVPTTWRGRTVLRLAFVNPDTQPARVIDVLDTLR